MGDLIYLDARRKPHFDPPQDTVPAFLFDLACPFSYLAAERIERVLGNAEWVPVSGGQRPGGSDADALRDRAERRARELRLPLVWPDRFPAELPGALRAAAYAAELGAGARFALAAFRLAFCGGFDLEDPEALAVAAATAGVPLDGCLEAAADPGQDEPLLIGADELRARGVNTVPAIEAGGQVFGGEDSLPAASIWARARVVSIGPLSPAG